MDPMRRRTLLKVIVLGDNIAGAIENGMEFLIWLSFSRVGKTSLMNQYPSQQCHVYFTTITHTSEAISNVWDTAGQERFHSLGAAFYRGADCCVLAYDVNVGKTFESLSNWHEEFLKQVSSLLSSYDVFNDIRLDIWIVSVKADPADLEAFPFILLGNKIDIDGGHSRVVSEKRAKEWCASRGNIPYFETSAKEDYNVDEAFLCVAQTALASERQQDIYFQGISETVSEVEQRGGCAC
ncbi:hypothetical protein BT93_I0328 [Corymbia citriodora subsp. variegata]|nr:hypothetical protein BT93_I0328 [Corymbia citriodora subsp. variegata]